jgi:hypothetical protein
MQKKLSVMRNNEIEMLALCIKGGLLEKQKSSNQLFGFSYWRFRLGDFRYQYFKKNLP